MNQLNFFATAPIGLELLLADELQALGATHTALKLAGVEFKGDLSIAYRACLWSRLANRILLRLAIDAPVRTAEDLYVAIQTIDWSAHIHPTGTLSVHCVSAKSLITHSLFAAQKIKDAIVDQLRETFGVRPNVARIRAQVNVYVYLHQNKASIYIDLSGESLHKRGYRLTQVEAPLKENLAAALLIRANWQNIANHHGTLLDPMCGSGTLLIEGAAIAGNIAPGLTKTYFGFQGWKQHQPAMWQKLLDDAQEKRNLGLASLPTIIGYDADVQAIKIAFENIERAGLRGKIHVERRELALFAPLPKNLPGLVITNPPYGERLGETARLEILYQQFGERLKDCFCGWHAALFTGNIELAKKIGLRAKRYYHFFNGTIPCKLFLIDVLPERFIDQSIAAQNARRIHNAKYALAKSEINSSAIQMFINRLRKNLKHFRKKAQRAGLATYRIYDADLPDYAFAIDIAPDGVQVIEYKAPKIIKMEKVLRRRQEVLSTLPQELCVKPTQIFLKIESPMRNLINTQSS